MAAHILQVAYYETLLEIRAKMLQAAGYQVTSVLRNQNAFNLDSAVVGTVDLIVVGFSTEQPMREAMIHWFKTNYPAIPVIALQLHSWENFPEADVATLSEHPKVWLAAVASVLKSRASD